MNELAGAAAFLAGTLKGDSALSAVVASRVYADFAPAEPAPVYPLVRFHMQAAEDVLGGFAQRLFTQPLYLVAVVGRDCGYGPLQAAADRVDALLTVPAPVTATIGGETFLVRAYRERPFALSYVSEGARFSELGGLYRLIVEPA